MKLLDSQNRINELMSRFVAQVKGATAMRRTDINSIAETILIPLFAEVYGYTSLKNLNISENTDYPAIDLGDTVARVAIQVTSTSDSEKVKNTLRKFIGYKLYEEYDRLIIYILTEKRQSYSGSGYDEIIQNKFAFDKDKDIRDYRDVLQEVSGFQIDKTCRVEEILEANFGDGSKPLFWEVYESRTEREAIQLFQPEPWIQPLTLQKLKNGSKDEIGLLDALGENDKIALVGNSGSGKTYAMRIAASTLGRNSSHLCFWIPLRSYTHSLERTIKRTLGWYDLQDDQVVPTLQKHRITLLLDGLNEVRAEDRKQCTREIQHLLDTYRGQLCISYPLSDNTYFGFDCPTYKISPLTKGKIEQAIKTFFSAKGEPGKATWFLQSIRGWNSERQRDFDALVQTPINLQFVLELVQADDFVYSSLRDLYGQVIQKRLERTKRHDQLGQITVDTKTECLMDLAYQSIIEDHPLQMQKAFVKSVFFGHLSSSQTALALEEIIRTGLLLEVNEFFVEWPHPSFRDYLAGRRLFDLVETDKSFNAFPLEKLEGAAAAAHATKLVTTQSRRLGKRSAVFLKLLYRHPSFEAMKVVAEEYHTSTNQDLKCDARRYEELRWGERFLETYQLVADVARQRGFPGVDGIPSPKGLTVFFDSEADFCAMMFSEKKGIHFDQLQNFQAWTLRSKKRKKSCAGFCLFAPFLLLLDPEILAYLQVGVWLRLKAKHAKTELSGWHEGLATYIRPRNESIRWSQPQELPEPKFELCAGPQETFRILHQTYGVAQVNRLRTVADILVHSRKEFLSWEEIYMPITFQIDPTKVQDSPKPVSNRLSQMMVLTPPSHYISLALLMPWSHKTDLGVSIFVPFPVPLLNRYYFCNSITTSGNLSLSFVHLRG